MKHYIHHVPGRVRVKSPVVRRNPDAIEDINALFKEVDGVKCLQINPLTGSIVINYDQDILDAENLLENLENAGYYNSRKALKINNDEIIRSASRAGAEIGKTIMGVCLQEALTSLVLAAI